MANPLYNNDCIYTPDVCVFKSDINFPELLPKSDKSFDKLHIMWCGRMIWWKHPEHAVEVARILKEKGIPFEMQMIGNGDKRQTVEKLIKKYDLSNNILLHDFMSPADIRKTMNNANIYVVLQSKFRRGSKNYEISGADAVSLNRAQMFLLE